MRQIEYPQVLKDTNALNFGYFIAVQIEYFQFRHLSNSLDFTDLIFG